MMHVFLTILDMSFSASWIVLAVLAARFVLKKAPRWLVCGLWALVALRLLCPFTLESALSLVPRQTMVQEATQELLDDYVGPTHTYFDITPEYELAREAGLPTFSAGEAPHHYVVTGETPITHPTTLGDILPQLGCCIWLAGIAALLVYAAVSYYRISKRVQVSIHLDNGVYLCDYIDTPFLLGLFRPKIYLPSSMDPRDASHVLAHERAHLRRCDHWWKPLGFILLTLHWFNPLLWVAYVLLCRDIELACDERVIKEMGPLEKKAYSEALLKCSIPRHMIAACPLAFGEVSVNQRVKSVLHYRKPSFWVLLVSIVVIMILAVCFLTGPMNHTLGKILDISQKDIVRIDVCSRKGTLRLETGEEIDEFRSFLDTIEYDPEPIADTAFEGDFDENQWDRRVIRIYYPDYTEYVLMNYDRSLVWTRDGDGSNSLPYSLTDQEAFVTFLQQHATPVLNQRTTAAPFATMTQPEQWLQGITVEAVKKARAMVVEPYSITGGYLSPARLSEVIDVLNRIPSGALSNEQTDEAFDYFKLRYFNDRDTGYSGVTLILEDGANGLTGILRLYKDNLELVLLEGHGVDSSLNDNAIYPARIWSVDNNELRDILLTMENTSSPTILTFAGSRYDFREELEVITDGNATIRTKILLDWDYEIVQPGQKGGSFGFRCRPHGEDGWLYFSWWPEGFVSGMEAEMDQGYNRFGVHYTLYSSTDEVTGILNYDRYHCIHGDYVILNEGADSWMETYREDLSYIEMFASVECAKHLELTEIPGDVEQTLDEMAFYDWDSIAREIGTAHMALFDPQTYGNCLFVGCRHEDGYHIACFESTTDGYQYIGLLQAKQVFVDHADGIMIPSAEFSGEYGDYRFFVIEDPSITGIEYCNGASGYIPITQTPTLVLMDKSQWSIGSPDFILREDDPPAMRMQITNSRRDISFEAVPPETYPNRYYLYNADVRYFDGVHQPGQYSLTNEEIRELRDILSNIPPANIYYRFQPEMGDLDVSIELWLDDGEATDWEHLVLSLHRWNGNIYLILNYPDDFNTLYFQIEDAALDKFMQSKCDDSRKEDSYSTYHVEPIAYSYGDISFKLNRFLGWEYEIVEYTDEQTPFGIRCRPLGEKDGWQFFSYWPNGFAENPNYSHYEGTISFNILSETGAEADIPYLQGAKEGSSVWEYVLFPTIPGNYVLVNDGADSWLEDTDRYPMFMFEPDSFGEHSANAEE